MPWKPGCGITSTPVCHGKNTNRVRRPSLKTRPDSTPKRRGRKPCRRVLRCKTAASLCAAAVRNALVLLHAGTPLSGTSRARPFGGSASRGIGFLMTRPGGVADPEGVPFSFTACLGDNDYQRGHAYYFPLRINPTVSDDAGEQRAVSTPAMPHANLSKSARAYLAKLGMQRSRHGRENGRADLDARPGHRLQPGLSDRKRRRHPPRLAAYPAAGGSEGPGSIGGAGRANRGPAGHRSRRAGRDVREDCPAAEDHRPDHQEPAAGN